MSAESAHSADGTGLVARHRLAVALSMLGGFELLLAAGSAPPLIAGTGVVGGVALMATAWWRVARFARWGLLLLGTVPFAVLTWWSIASPLTALLAAGIGGYLIRQPDGRDSPRSTTELDLR